MVMPSNLQAGPRLLALTSPSLVPTTLPPCWPSATPGPLPASGPLHRLFPLTGRASRFFRWLTLIVRAPHVPS